MLPRNHPDRIQIAFDDHRLVANAGHPSPPPRFPAGAGAPETPRAGPTPATRLTLVASALAGGDCIDDADAPDGPHSARSRRHPPWEAQLAVGATFANWTG